MTKALNKLLKCIYTALHVSHDSTHKNCYNFVSVSNLKDITTVRSKFVTKTRSIIRENCLCGLNGIVKNPVRFYEGIKFKRG